MGCDIHGYVEVKHYNGWRPIMDLGEVVDRSYGAFAMFFGVRGVIEPGPVAKRRGLPEDVGVFVRKQAQDCSDWHSHTWISYEEIKMLELDEQFPFKNDDLAVYRRMEDNALQFVNRDPMPPALFQDISRDELMPMFRRVKEMQIGDEIEQGGFVHRCEAMRRRYFLSDAWIAFLGYLDALVLNNCVNPKYLRLVVWFDN